MDAIYTQFDTSEILNQLADPEIGGKCAPLKEFLGDHALLGKIAKAVNGWRRDIAYLKDPNAKEPFLTRAECRTYLGVSYHNFALEAGTALIDKVTKLNFNDSRQIVEAIAFKLIKLDDTIYAIAKHNFNLCFSYSMADKTCLDALKDLGPLIEMGAGTGFWAKLLKEEGVDILPYDKEPPLKCNRPKYQFKAQHIEILKGDTSVLEDPLNVHRSLFLCWPDKDTTFASDALKAFKGEFVAYIGQPRGGVTANDEFFDILESDFNLIRTVEKKQWDTVPDKLYIYEKAKRDSNSNESDASS